MRGAGRSPSRGPKGWFSAAQPGSHGAPVPVPYRGVPWVARLSVAPVKSMGLQHPQEVRLEQTGVPGNRLFFLVDAGDRLVEATRYGRLVAVRVHYDPAAEHLRLAFPDGAVVRGTALPDGAPLVTSFRGRPVLARVVPGPFAQAVSAFLGAPVRLVRCERPGDANDAWPVSLVSTASLGELARRVGAPVDPRRFRMLVEVAGCLPHQEDSWIGRRVRVGEVVIRVVEPDPRCALTAHDPETGRRDLATLRTIAAYRGRRDGRRIDFGVYADVESPGRVRVGEPVEVLRP